jgi:riboflavin biosynthesis pyrimidine reductase
METLVTRLFPAPSITTPLSGLYLSHELRRRGSPEHPYIYSNFVASVDGRISQPDPITHRRGPPPAITHHNDWRLYLELAAQADAVVTSSSRLRELCNKDENELQCVRETAEGDLKAWRDANRLTPHPACIVLANSLDMPWETLAQRAHGEIIVLSSAAPSSEQRRMIGAASVELITVSGGNVSGADVLDVARQRGLRTLYSIGGPQILYTFVAARLLNRLYVSIALKLLAGKNFDTLLNGDWLSPPLDLSLSELNLDSSDQGKSPYLFAVFDTKK